MNELTLAMNNVYLNLDCDNTKMPDRFIYIKDKNCDWKVCYHLKLKKVSFTFIVDELQLANSNLLTSIYAK